MTQTVKLQHHFVEFVPDELVEGHLYVSLDYATVVHLCCCGCHAQVVTPLYSRRLAIDLRRGNHLSIALDRELEFRLSLALLDSAWSCSLGAAMDESRSCDGQGAHRLGHAAVILDPQYTQMKTAEPKKVRGPFARLRKWLGRLK